MIDNESKWYYTIAWYTQGNKPSFEEEIQEMAQGHIAHLCEEQELLLKQIEMQSNSLKIKINSDIQLNINKLVKDLQKKLQAITDLVDEEKTLITTTSSDLSEKDRRLEKLLNSVIDAEYYDMEDSFTSQLEDLKSYLLAQKLSVIEKNDQIFLVDEEALNHEINLNCFACTKLYKYGCCCGSPCNLGPRNKKVFDKHLLNIEEEVKAYDEATYKKILAKGGFIASDGSINECDGHCALLVEEEGIYKCIAHSYALKRDIPIYEICPLSCLMYPLEIIELITNKQRKLLLLTSVVSEDFARRFGRWGSYNTLEVELRCINKKAHNDVFKEEDYRPVYKVNKDLLCHEFGSTFYESLEEVL